MFDEEKEEPTVTPDTENATHFHAIEAPPDQRKKFKRFHGYNSGVYNGEWQDNAALRRLDNLALYDAVAGQLELTDFQKRTGKELFDGFNQAHLGYTTTLVAFSTCAYVCRKDGRIYHPERSDENNDSLFVAFESDVPETKKQIRAGFTKITGRLP